MIFSIIWHFYIFLCIVVSAWIIIFVKMHLRAWIYLTTFNFLQGGGKKEPSRYEKQIRKFAERKKNSKSMRAVTISIEGRNMALWFLVFSGEISRLYMVWVESLEPVQKSKNTRTWLSTVPSLTKKSTVCDWEASLRRDFSLVIISNFVWLTM